MNYLLTIKIPFHKSTSCSPIAFIDFVEEVPKFCVIYRVSRWTAHFWFCTRENDIRSHFKHLHGYLFITSLILVLGPIKFIVHNFVIGRTNVRVFPSIISSLVRSRYPMFSMKLLIVLMCAVTPVGSHLNSVGTTNIDRGTFLKSEVCILLSLELFF